MGASRARQPKLPKFTGYYGGGLSGWDLERWVSGVDGWGGVNRQQLKVVADEERVLVLPGDGFEEARS